MKLIVGLGNPGSQYKFTRHNAGFLVVDEIAKKLNVNFKSSKFNGEIAKSDDIILGKPSTFMNKSGLFVAQVANFYKIHPDDIMIIHDEKDLDLGKSIIKVGGSGGSHNGVIDVITQLGSRDFKRLKIGINSPERKGELKNFVLGNFTPTEFTILQEVIQKAAEASVLFGFTDILTIMNKYNAKK